LVEVEVESTPLSPPLSSVEVLSRVEKESSNSDFDSVPSKYEFGEVEIAEPRGSMARSIQVSSLKEPRSSPKIQVSSF
jgi:hypothetical protein